jgi:hypothetical protein
LWCDPHFTSIIASADFGVVRDMLQGFERSALMGTEVRKRKHRKLYHSPHIVRVIESVKDYARFQVFTAVKV